MPVVAVAALSFALGIVYSLFIYFTRYLRRRAKNTLATKNRTLSEREKSLSEKEAGAAARPGQAGEDPLRQPGTGDPRQSPPRKARFFGRRPGDSSLDQRDQRDQRITAPGKRKCRRAMATPAMPTGTL